MAELLILLFALFLLVSFFIIIRRKIRSREREKKTAGFLSFLYKLLVFFGIVYFSFVAIWGLNYQRLLLGDIIGLKSGDFSGQELVQLCDKLTERANGIRSGLSEDRQEVMKIEDGFAEICRQAQLVYSEAARTYPELSGSYGRPKAVFLSELMSRLGITGIYFPFTGEANINVAIPDCLLPATICHEMAHQRGFAREDEANYLAWLVCKHSQDEEFEYSGTLLALLYAMNALYDEDPGAAAEIQKKYGRGLRADLLAWAQYWQKYEGKAQEIASQVNDAYLKSNKQRAGVKSYGKMVDLLLAEQRAGKI